MKKIIAFIGIAAMAVSLTACGGGQSAQTSQAPEASVEVTTGGWTLPDSVTGSMSNEAGDAFEAALRDYKDEPLIKIQELGSQVVSGANYMVLCTDAPKTKWEVAVVYNDLSGKASITKVTPFDLGKYAQEDAGEAGEQGLAGGWTIYEDPSGEAAELPQEVATAFYAAMEGLTGADYEPVLYMGSQVVNGSNYAVLCKQTLVTADPVTNLAMVYIYAPATGDPEVMNIYPLDLTQFNQ